MKKYLSIILVIFFFVQSFCFAWDWEPYGPEDIKANKVIIFNEGPASAVICIDSGMYLKTSSSGEFEYFAYAKMPVVDVLSSGFSDDSLLLIMSDGSWSDGIYAFNPVSEQFNVIHYCFHPQFVVYNFYTEQFFVGHEYGLLVSDDGLTWTTIPFFENNLCLDIELNDQYLIVATGEENNNTFLSENNGIDWTELEGENITDLDGIIWPNYTFYGICKSELESGGLFQLNINDLVWENIFSSPNLNTVEMNYGGELYIGWHSGTPPNEGVAIYIPELEYLNDGLPDLNINSIFAPTLFGATYIYACTDSGVFFRILSVGVDENTKNEGISIYPNPVKNQANIRINYSELFTEIVLISVLNNQGQKVDEIEVEESTSNKLDLVWSKGNLPAGVYYLVIKTGKEQISEKFIIL